MSDKEELKDLLINRTIVDVELDERYTKSGKAATLKLTFDNGYSLKFSLGDHDNPADRPLAAM